VRGPGQGSHRRCFGCGSDEREASRTVHGQALYVAALYKELTCGSTTNGVMRYFSSITEGIHHDAPCAFHGSRRVQMFGIITKKKNGFRGQHSIHLIIMQPPPSSPSPQNTIW
jgi:hypothetical protein